MPTQPPHIINNYYNVQPPLLLFQPLLLFGTREYVEKGLACSPSGLFNFPLLFAPANCLEIV